MTSDARLRRPVVVLGAARSGTKMLRDALTAHPRLGAVPYDINYVWKFGNYAQPHDELTPEQLTERSVRFIRRYLEGWLNKTAAERLVEKTVSNTLRVEFVAAVLPDCRFVHLLRDGRDVAVSARRMWQQPLDWRRLLAKARRFPLRAVPQYGLSYLGAHLERRFRRNGAMSTWGPRFAGIDEAVRAHSLIEVCALQWRRSVEATRAALAALPADTSIAVEYESLVTRPEEELERIMDFLGLGMTGETQEYARRSIHNKAPGRWREELAPDELAGLMAHIGPLLVELGYGGA